MLAIVLNVAAVTAAAAHIGIIGEDAISLYLGMRLSPVTPELIAVVVMRLPLAAASAFSIEVPGDCVETPAVQAFSDHGWPDNELQSLAQICSPS